MGWLILLFVFAAALGASWLLGVRGGLLKGVAAALLLGATGYALQGRPDLPGSPAELAYQRAAELAPGRPAAPFFYGLALARSGDRQGAVDLWKRILAKAPPDVSWRPLIEQGVAALSVPPKP